MKALILNSGQGSRMGELTKEKPKCMSNISEDYTILSWQLKILAKCGINEVIITTGPFVNILEKHVIENNCGMNIRFVNNSEYDKTNYIYSMLLAKEDLANDDIISLHGDLVLEESVVRDLIHAKTSVVTIDSTVPLPEKDFKAVIENQKIKAIGIEFMNHQSVACQPAYKFRKEDFSKWMNEIASLCQKGITNVYAENALNSITSDIDLMSLELNGRLCNEIDNAKDLEIVSKKFGEIR